MGLFSKWTNKEATPAPEGAAAETPKSEVKEEKTAVETGRERVASIREGIKGSWNKWSGKARDAGTRMLGWMADLGYGAIGGVEKGGKKAVATVESGSKYVSESQKELGEIAKREVGYVKTGAEAYAEDFSNWAGDTADSLGRDFDTQMHNLDVWTQEKVANFNAVRDAAKADFDGGVMRLNNWAQEKVDTYKKFKKNVEHAPADAKKVFEQLKGEVISGITERFKLISEGVKSDVAKAQADVSRKKDTFLGWANNKRMEFAGTAGLKGEVAELRNLIERQSRLIDTLTKMQSTNTEHRFSMEEEDEGIVEFTKDRA